jgi:transcriptional regulator with XRE-family HTH domain
MECEQFPKALGERIRAARKTVQLSQEKLAERANLHPTYISDIERGKVNASITTYCQVARALDIPLAELLSLPEDPSDLRVSNELASLYARIRILNSKKQDAFFEAARNILSSIEGL